MGASMLFGMNAAGPLVGEEIVGEKILAEIKALNSQLQANKKCFEMRKIEIEHLTPSFKSLNKEYQIIRALDQRDETIKAQIQAFMQKHKKKLETFQALNARIQHYIKCDGTIEAKIQALMQDHKETLEKFQAEMPIEKEEQQMLDYFVEWLDTE